MNEQRLNVQLNVVLDIGRERKKLEEGNVHAKEAPNSRGWSKQSLAIVSALTCEMRERTNKRSEKKSFKIKAWARFDL